MNAVAAFEPKSLHNVSKEQGVYEQLRQAITSGALKPGQRLIPVDLGRQLDVSSMPVRDALLRLEVERLVTRTPHKEFVITPYSSKDISELYAIRAAVDSLAARLAAEHVTPATLKELHQIQRRAEEQLARGDIEALMATNRQFHSLLYKQSGNEQLLEIIQALRDRCSRYRAARYGVPETPKETVAAHRKIYAALAQGKPDLVEELVRKDMEATGRTLLRLVAEQEREDG